jgi:AcrR family transcriptional regulator
MAFNDNSVNIKIEKRGYHHGDLRQTAIDEGLRLLEQSDADHLSLREIARNIGVSATALYRHFPEKQALLDALAAAGAELLGVAQMKAMQAVGGGVNGFNASGRAYVRFALANPALFRLIMSCRPADDSLAMRFLRENVAEFAPATATAQQRRVYAYRAWSMVHGLATLMLDGLIPPHDALIREVIDGQEIWADVADTIKR